MDEEPFELCLLFSPIKDSASAEKLVALVEKKLQERRLVVQKGIHPGDSAPLLKVGAPFAELCAGAEREGLAKYLSDSAVHDGLHCERFDDPLRGGGGRWQKATLLQFQRSCMEDFEHAKQPDTFFEMWERLFILRRLLAEVPPAPEVVPAAMGGEMLVDALLREGMLAELLPLNREHHGWRWQQLSPLRPEGIEQVRNAFGPSVAMYFVFMRTFTLWLLPPGAVGLLLALCKPTTVTVDDWWCLPFFAMGMVLWAAAFPRLVQQQESIFAWRWGCLEAERSEVLRPGFYGEIAISPVTGDEELVYPTWKRWLKYATSAAVTAGLLCVAFGVMICSLNLQGYVHHPGEEGAEGLETWSNPFYIDALAQFADPGRIFDPSGAGDPCLGGWITMVPVVMHVVAISLMNAGYRRVAQRLTVWENHRTDSAFENSMIVKRFLFEAFDAYVALFYVGFFMRDPVRLRQELAALYTVDSLRRVTLESAVPWLRQQFAAARAAHARAEAKRDDNANANTTDAALAETLARGEYAEFDDFLEMVIGFGYVILFAGAMPLASALTVLSNVVEMHSDVFKLHTVCRRPAAHPASGMPRTWFGALCCMCWAAIVTNCVFAYVSSEQMMQLLPQLFKRRGDQHHMRRAGYWALFGVEHLLLVVACGVREALPRRARCVSIALKAREHRRRRGLRSDA